MGGSKEEGALALNPLGAKQSILPRTATPHQRKPGGAWPLPSPSTCPHAAATAVPASGPRCSAGRAGMPAQETWLAGASAPRAPRGSLSGRDVAGARRRGEVGGGELERQGWRQVQRVPAAPWRGSFLPSSLPFSFLPSPPDFLPCFPSFSFLPSLLPAFLTPPPLLLSLPSPRTKPARAWLPAGPPSGP